MTSSTSIVLVLSICVGLSICGRERNRYVESNDTLSLRFAGVASDNDDGKAALLVDFFLEDRRKNGGDDAPSTIRLSLPGEDNRFRHVEPEKVELRPGETAELRVNISFDGDTQWHRNEKLKFTLEAVRIRATPKEKFDMAWLTTALTPFDFVSPPVTSRGVVAVDVDRTSPAATAKVVDNCANSTDDEQRWSALFWVWDRGSGLGTVEVKGLGERDGGSVHYKHLSFPVGSTSRFLVTSSAPCGVLALTLTAVDVRNNKLEVVAANVNIGNNASIGKMSVNVFILCAFIVYFWHE